jgi:hypothetical protein
MSLYSRLTSLFISLIFVFISCIAVAQQAAPPAGNGNGNGNGGGGGGSKGGGGKTVTLSTVKSKDWSESHVRRVLAAFAYGGLATDAQIEAWGNLKPAQAVAEILTFNPVNSKLSPPDGGDDTELHCHSLRALQEFWSADVPGNVMRYDDRKYYATLNTNTSPSVSRDNLQRTWSKAISTRGCNSFLHKMGLYLTNYHASISVHKTYPTLIRDYYDTLVGALSHGADFVETMQAAATHAAVARAYGHQYSVYDNANDNFYGTDDFGREFHQLFFRIQGDTEDPVYHEDTTIEHTAWLLSGMRLDKAVSLTWGSTSANDWYVAPIVFTDHQDPYSGKWIYNLSYHYNSVANGPCLDILHVDICGNTAAEKIANLAPVAAAHVESMDNVPVSIIDFFADDNLDASKIAQIRGSWADANFDLLVFMRDYASSTAFHNASTYKFKTAFDRNLAIANANTLTNEAVFGRDVGDSPYYPMRDQDAEIFEPAHDVFGGQTGFQAATNRYIFKDAYWDHSTRPWFLYDTDDTYSLDGVDSYVWEQDWGSVIPVNGNGDHVVSEVATYLWNHFIGDGGKNFDEIARAQVQALLATRRDFGYTVDVDNPEVIYNTNDLASDPALSVNQTNAGSIMSLQSGDTGTRRDANRRVGMAVNFITMTPYAFAMEGQ